MSEAPRQVLRAPRAELADFIEKLWLVEAPAQPHARERILPDGSMTLVLNLADDEVRLYAPDGACTRLRGASLHGAQATPFVIDTAEQSRVVGVHFKPGGAYPFFGVAAGELSGRHTSLAELWGGAADSLRSELLEARTDSARFAALERALLRRVAASPPSRHAGMLAALRALASHQPPERVATLADRLGVSPRRLASRFEDEVGLAPKRLARILRFQRALAALASPARAANLARVALDAGYFDHAHFVRDFRAFAGTSPTELIAAGGNRANHVAVPE
jgi:AraC-like DNA-binding protein